MQDQDQRGQLALKFVLLLNDLHCDCNVLQSLPEIPGADLAFLFTDRAEHLSGWDRVCSGRPSAACLMDFCVALAAGAVSERGCQRVKDAKGVIQSMKFVAGKLGLRQFMDNPNSPARPG